MTRIAPANDSAILFSDLEQMVGQYPVRSLRVTGADRSLLGLFLLPDTAETTEVTAALSRLVVSLQGHHNQEAAGLSGPPSSLAGVPGPRQLKKIIRAELDRVQLTRLPCSLLLLETDAPATGQGSPGEGLLPVIEAVKECLHHVDILIRRDDESLAILLPGTNLGKAVQRAKAISRVVAAPQATAGDAVRMGIALCYASDRLDGDQFLAMAEKELARARRPGGDPICHVSGIRAEDACQVSVEERAQLFGFLVKDTN